MMLNLDQSVQILKQGGVVCFPTETVYGLGAVATNAQAIDQVYQIKKRPRDNPLICHFHGLVQIGEYASEISDLTRALIGRFSPGPLSFVIDIPPNSPLLPATCGLSSMVARIPNHPVTLELIKLVGEPIVGPSANTSGKFSGTDSQMVQADLASKTQGILDGGACRIGLESTIIDARDGETIKILRQGVVGKPELELFLKKSGQFDGVKVLTKEEQDADKRTIPGNKYKHYAPRTPLSAIQSILDIPQRADMAILLEDRYYQDLKGKTNFKLINLGKTLDELAKDLYRNLFALDQLGVSAGYILLPVLDESSLALAIKDKLDRVLAKNS